jgi:V/A-type H+-transporting ATPase subunit I
MSVFGSPQYGSIDATPFVAFFFPLFFGVILGDMGYALVLLGLAFWLKARFKKAPIAQDVAMIVALAGISSFFFGFVYGEFFGDMPHRLGIIREASVLGIGLPVDREKQVMGMLFFAIGLGAIQILLGLGLGIMNAIRSGHRKHAVEKAGLFLTLVGCITIGIGTQVKVPLMTPGAIMLIASVPLLVYGGGFLGILEILGTLGNVLSYARIMALGLVSVMLAKLANDTGMSLKGNILLAIVAATLIHAVNLLIHVFTPSIHALRLNFVEFFGKFYEFGGREYKPFQRGGVE